MSLPNPGMTFTPFDPLPASDLNDMVENIEALADGSAFNAQAIPGYKVKINPPQGMMTNGQISRTVSSNNITVALKTLAGADPSASDPVYIRIGNTMRAVTAALGVTKNAGTNWMDLGSVQHATQDVDVFVYLGYNATDGVIIGFSRIPYAVKYSDFNTTNTNPRYAAISTISNASANDAYEVVGRVNVTLSATASFNWSVPATSYVVNKPINETRTLTYAPTLVNISGGTTNFAQYQIVGKRVIGRFKYTLSGANITGAMEVTAPITPGANELPAAGYNFVGQTNFLDNGNANYLGATGMLAGGTMQLAAGQASGAYTVMIGTSALIPFTWGSTDVIYSGFNYSLE